MVHIDQDWGELFPPPHIAADSQRPQGVAMIALAARDIAMAVPLPLLPEILIGQLQSCLYRFGTTGHEIRIIQTVGRTGCQKIRQVFQWLVREEACMGERQSIHLILHRLDRAGMGMAQTTDRRPAGRIQITLAVRIDNVTPIALNSGRRGRATVAVKNMGHDRVLCQMIGLRRHIILFVQPLTFFKRPNNQPFENLAQHLIKAPNDFHHRSAGGRHDIFKCL